MATMMGHLTLTSAPEVSTESLGEASADAEAADGPWVVTEIIKMIKHVCKLGAVSTKRIFYQASLNYVLHL